MDKRQSARSGADRSQSGTAWGVPSAHAAGAVPTCGSARARCAEAPQGTTEEKGVTMERATRIRRVVLLIAAAAAAAALVGGLFSSRATATSPSPASGKVTLKIGALEPPDNMNPFIGWSDIVYEF